MSEVVMIEDMEKNTTIERCFEHYFDGTPLPPCDLTEAKRVVSARARSDRRTFIAAVSSIVAVCAGIFILGFVLLFKNILGLIGKPLPDGSASNSYQLSQTTSASMSFSELNGKYSVMSSFAPFSLSDNSDAQYTLHFAGDRAVLLRADLRYTDGNTSFRATVWCDLTQGEYSISDFEEYRALMEGGDYGSETEYINGEYVSRACMLKSGTEYVIDMMSPNRGSLDMLVSALRK